eukprot:CAMPEP_0181339406 /NCGR_PEP_ID=MMETSP1101-20121128/29239_1 /TAXON_ID=46948 /ORGANISM="Rhodomonas abbreviata, Strain Caron Lab Isolate" /LENGTH=37 /DNA_ID= /DNA_START= /DNA_END= /DNA_ORIENTATION=
MWNLSLSSGTSDLNQAATKGMSMEEKEALEKMSGGGV